MTDTYIAEIKSSTDNADDEVKKIFLSYQSSFFIDKQSLKFSIQKEIADRFKVSIGDIRICGSAHLGESPHKGLPFKIKESDLDVAIINTDLFSKYIQISKAQSKNLTDISSFPNGPDSGATQRDKFCYYAAIGYFRPDLMPHCPQRNEWMSFFGKMSSKYNAIFKNINCGLYASEGLFLDKQYSAIETIKNRRIKTV